MCQTIDPAWIFDTSVPHAYDWAHPEFGISKVLPALLLPSRYGDQCLDLGAPIPMARYIYCMAYNTLITLVIAFVVCIALYIGLYIFAHFVKPVILAEYHDFSDVDKAEEESERVVRKDARERRKYKGLLLRPREKRALIMRKRQLRRPNKVRARVFQPACRSHSI